MQKNVRKIELGQTSGDKFMPGRRTISRTIDPCLQFVLTIIVVIIFSSCSSENGTTIELTGTTDWQNDTRWQIDTVEYNGGYIEIIHGFDGAFGLTVHNDGSIYVSDIWRGQVVRFTRDLRPNGWLGMVDGTSSIISGWHYNGEPRRCSEYGAFDMPHSVDFDKDGNIYVADYGTGRIQRYTPDGTLLGLFFDNPPSTNLALDGTANAYFDKDYNLWVSDFNLHRITKFDSDGNLIGWMGERTSGEATGGFTVLGTSEHSTSLYGFNKPQMVRVDRFGNFYVVEIGNHRIQKFSPNGTLIGWLGARRDGTITDGWAIDGLAGETDILGGFRNPVSLEFIQGDTMIIVDNGNNRIQKFTYDGKFVSWMGGKLGGGVTNGWETTGLSQGGNDPGMFLSPYDAIIYNNKLYVADGHNGRIQIFDLL